jgi:hypothetical protein
MLKVIKAYGLSHGEGDGYRDGQGDQNGSGHGDIWGDGSGFLLRWSADGNGEGAGMLWGFKDIGDKTGEKTRITTCGKDN